MPSTEVIPQATLIEKCPELVPLESGLFSEITKYLHYVINEYTKCATKQNSRTK